MRDMWRSGRPDRCYCATKLRWLEHALALLGLAFLGLIAWTWIDMKSDEKRRAEWAKKCSLDPELTQPSEEEFMPWLYPHPLTSRKARARRWRPWPQP